MKKFIILLMVLFTTTICYAGGTQGRVPVGIEFKESPEMVLYVKTKRELDLYKAKCKRAYSEIEFLIGENDQLADDLIDSEDRIAVLLEDLSLGVRVDVPLAKVHRIEVGGAGDSIQDQSFATYSGAFGKQHFLNADYRGTSLGYGVKGAYTAKFDIDELTYYLGVSAKKDTITLEDYTNLMAGIGKDVYETDFVNIKLSIAANINNGRYVTSLRSKIGFEYGKAKAGNVTYYYPELSKITNDLSFIYKIDENYDLTAKLSHVNAVYDYRYGLAFKF